MRDRVEAVAAVHGVFVFVQRHVVAETAAPVRVGLGQRERAVARLLDVEIGGGDPAAGGGVVGMRIHRDRAGVIEFGARRAGTRGDGVELDGEGVCALVVAGLVGRVVGDGVGAVV